MLLCLLHSGYIICPSPSLTHSLLCTSTSSNTAHVPSGASAPSAYLLTLKDPPDPLEFVATANLINTKCDLLQAHHHFGHAGCHNWACKGKYDLLPSLMHCQDPICLVCQYSQACKQVHPSTTWELAGHVSAPGAFISMDNMVPGTGGHIPFHIGWASNCQYWYCSLWANHYSKFLHGHFQEHANTQKTIQLKRLLKPLPLVMTFASNIFILIMDMFASTEFRQHLEAHSQHHSICSVSTHLQNGVVEHYIGVITNHTHTMLFHAMTAWPNIITADVVFHF